MNRRAERNAQLAQLVPSVANVRSYAQVVYEKFLVRSLIKVGREIVTSATEGTDSAELQLDAAEQRLYDIRKGQENSDLVVIKDILATETLDHLTALDDPEQRKKLAGIPTGFSDVDAMIGGLNKSDLIIVGARPGMGKTSFAFVSVGLCPTPCKGIIPLTLFAKTAFLRGIIEISHTKRSFVSV